MRDALRAHAPAVAGFATMLVVALVLAGTLQAGTVTTADPVPVVASDPIPLPGPGEDRDGDSYGDDVDLWDGDLHLRVEVLSLRVPDDALPYLHVGTQDDHWRLGRGSEMEWQHVVDPDALGHRAGSPGWQDEVLRTGAWWTSEPMEGASKAVAEGSVPDRGAVAQGVRWPQSFWINVRDDHSSVAADLHLRDARPDPDAYLGRWEVRVDVFGARARVGDAEWSPTNTTLTARDGDVEVTLRATLRTGPDPAEQAAWAERWAPRLHFDAGERFLPVNGSVLAEFNGFGALPREQRDYQTWTRDFNNGRDRYIFHVADFDGDGTTDHRDAAVAYDLVASGALGTPTVHASVHRATNDRVAVTYWFLYMYNFVRDVNGDDIRLLAHKGDREFVSLLFDGPASAANGTPEAVSYSQHYRGVRIPAPVLGQAPFTNGTHPDVYPAQGSHASYPVPGDDRRFRPAFVAYGDVFDGEGETWDPDDYDLVVLGSQSWHQGHLWGPVTRHGRDLGTARQPLLQHSFQYPYLDPYAWHRGLAQLSQDELHEAYGSPP